MLALVLAAAACSATGHDAKLAPVPGMHAKAAAMRQKIADAASRCDFEALERLGMPGEFHFRYDGPNTHPAAYWRAEERKGARLLLTMVEALRMPPYVIKDGQGKVLTYRWPSDDMGPRMAAFRKAGGEGGWHLFIQPDGDWIGFEYGD